MSTKPVENVCSVLFSVYWNTLHEASKNRHQFQELGEELGAENLKWMCETAIKSAAGWPLDKTNRWLGYVQAGLVAHGLTTVQAERDYTRPLFHAAYKQQGVAPPPSQSRIPQEFAPERRQGANGMYEGDRVWYGPADRTGVLKSVTQDGDADVRWDDDGTVSTVKWNMLAPSIN